VTEERDSRLGWVVKDLVGLSKKARRQHKSAHPNRTTSFESMKLAGDDLSREGKSRRHVLKPLRPEPRINPHLLDRRG
jgi:hypothetical protein